MSRPSITTWPSAPSSRCRSRITSRTSGCRATDETTLSMRASLIADVTSTESISTLSCGTNVIGNSRASAPSAAPSSSERPRSSASHVSARYIAPVSR
jgi:hypothetical protein